MVAHRVVCTTLRSSLGARPIRSGRGTVTYKRAKLTSSVLPSSGQGPVRLLGPPHRDRGQGSPGRRPVHARRGGDCRTGRDQGVDLPVQVCQRARGGQEGRPTGPSHRRPTPDSHLRLITLTQTSPFTRLGRQLPWVLLQPGQQPVVWNGGRDQQRTQPDPDLGPVRRRRQARYRG